MWGIETYILLEIRLLEKAIVIKHWKLAKLIVGNIDAQIGKYFLTFSHKRNTCFIF